MQLKGWQCRLWHRPAVRPKPTWEKCSTVQQPDRLWATDTTKVWCGHDGWASLVGVLDAGPPVRFLLCPRSGLAVSLIKAYNNV